MQKVLLNSVNEISNTFKKFQFFLYYSKLRTIWNNNKPKSNFYMIDLENQKILMKIHDLLENDELTSLSERLNRPSFKFKST